MIPDFYQVPSVEAQVASDTSHSNLSGATSRARDRDSSKARGFDYLQSNPVLSLRKHGEIIAIARAMVIMVVIVVIGGSDSDGSVPLQST